ncbi:hypothetical protein B7C42_08374 [Nocardia cerradoensis]|uniref:Uncharacterized protein n=1 Tax=Nocardia cerradoensis TaxID=85688 RepID=A0A231GSL1_9NOCA|nr:hypothetical protein B7C42_08374 [Nocardia cerradoensis]
MNPVTRKLWQLLHVDGESSRYRGEPERRNPAAAVVDRVPVVGSLVGWLAA